MTRRRVKLLLVVVALSLLRLCLASGQTLTALGYALHDDVLFLKLAEHIIAGRWLGPFDNLTLVTGPFYPLWIAASFIVGVPLQLSENLLYIAACVAVMLALRPVVRSAAVLVAIYAVMLFNPVTFSITRILREGIYISLTLLLAACLLGVFLRRRSALRSLALWAGGAGFALSGMWLTRGESLWILPAVVFILAAAALSLWRAHIDGLWRRCLVLVSPLAVLAATTATVSTINLFFYGVFVTTDVAGADWLAAYGALSRVEHDAWQQYAVVPRHVRERIYRVSPAFAELRPAIEGDLGRAWMSHGCDLMPKTCGDITAGWFMWLLRDAVARAGYYRSAPTAAGYYRRLADEVNGACRSGALRCGPPRATMVPPWRPEYRPLLFRSMATATTQVVRFEALSALSAPSYGTERILLPFRLITRDRLAPSVEAGVVTYGADSAKLSSLTTIIRIYGQLGPILTGVLIMTLLVAPIAMTFGYRSALLIPILTLVVAASARIVLIAFIDATSFLCIHPHYLGPAHPVLLLAGLLACAEMGSMLHALWIWFDARWSGRAVVVGAGGEANDRSAGAQ